MTITEEGHYIYYGFRDRTRQSTPCFHHPLPLPKPDMPELPEVETIRRGLAPQLEGAEIEQVRLNRADLRFAFPDHLAKVLPGLRIVHVGRRAKYLLFELSNGSTLLSHLGMTGSYRFSNLRLDEPSRYHLPVPGKHDHLEMALSHPHKGDMLLIYADPRRFGFFDWHSEERPSRYLVGLGPEPLGNSFNAIDLAKALAGRKAPIKSALLDQRLIAGLGNIYVSEALWRARISPLTPSLGLVRADGRPTKRLEALVAAIRAVLEDAIAAGGSTLRDFRNAEGGGGYFQHVFDVYDREDEPCRRAGCGGTVTRITQSGRSSFYCPVCQK